MPPTYRERLRVEGFVLAASGAAGSAALLALKTEDATRWPLNTAAQLAVVGGLLAWLGPRSVRRSVGAADELERGHEGSGEPTPLWQLPLITASLCASFVALGEVNSRAGWDAGLRITGGCVLVGLAQALVLERMVRAEERATGRTFVRIPGSRIGRGTRLGVLTQS